MLLIYQFINMEETIDNIINNFDSTTNRVNFEREELKHFLTFAAYDFFSFMMENTTLKLMVLLWDPL